MTQTKQPTVCPTEKIPESIFDFIMPGYLFSYKKFKENFEIAITKDEDSFAMKRLKIVHSRFLAGKNGCVLLASMAVACAFLHPASADASKILDDVKVSVRSGWKSLARCSDGIAELREERKTLPDSRWWWTDKSDKDLLKDRVEALLGRLCDLCRGVFLLHDLSERVRDEIVSFGERLSSAIVASVLDDAVLLDPLRFIKTVQRGGRTELDSELTAALIQGKRKPKTDEAGDGKKR